MAIIFLMYPTGLWATHADNTHCTWGTPPSSSTSGTALSASYTNVAACISEANTGDTINVPAGTQTWSSNIVLSKEVKLRGRVRHHQHHQGLQ
jgi:hypothetical protein